MADTNQAANDFLNSLDQNMTEEDEKDFETFKQEQNGFTSNNIKVDQNIDEKQYIKQENGQESTDFDNKEAVSKALQQIQERIKQQQTEVQNNQNVENGLGTKRKKHRWGAIPSNKDNEQQQQNKEQAKPSKEESQQQNGLEEKPKKRRSRWDTTGGEGNNENALTKVEDNKQLVTNKFPREVFLPGGIRVVMPASLTGEDVQIDPQIKKLYDKLNEISRKIMNNEYEHIPEYERSPSPEPVYDKQGVRLNTREVRWKEKLSLEKNLVIEELIMLDPTYKPPADYKPQKKHKRISIPFSNNPTFNYIGLIIGPRGNTQKRMQKETNTKIAIRGKGSIKEGSNKDPKYDYGEDEELHVLITGDTQEDVEKAGQMINELLEQSDDTRNEHKRLQLRELAALNGTLKDEQICYVCGDFTHTATECPKAQAEVYKLPQHMQSLVESQYAKDVTRMTGNQTIGQEDEYKKFLATLGGAPPPEETLPGKQANTTELQRMAAQKAAQLTATAPKRLGDDLPDDHKIYVGNLGQNIDDQALKRMFEPFGEVLAATVLMDFGTGQSKGFGFVTLTKADAARRAQLMMSGKIMDGRALQVRLRSDTSGGKQKFGPGENDEHKLYVQNIPKDIIEAQVRSTFGRYGPVVDVKIIIDKNTGLGKGYCFVTMDSPETAKAAHRGLNGQEIGGQRVLVKSCSKELQAQLEEENRQKPKITLTLAGTLPQAQNQQPQQQQQQPFTVPPLPGMPGGPPTHPPGGLPGGLPGGPRGLPGVPPVRAPTSIQGGLPRPPQGIQQGPPQGLHQGPPGMPPQRPPGIAPGQSVGGLPRPPFVPQFRPNPYIQNQSQPQQTQQYPGYPPRPGMGFPPPLQQQQQQQQPQQSYQAVPPPAQLQQNIPPLQQNPVDQEQQMMSEVEKFMQEVARVR